MPLTQVERNVLVTIIGLIESHCSSAVFSCADDRGEPVECVNIINEDITMLVKVIDDMSEENK